MATPNPVPTAPAEPVVTLSGVKYAAFASQETACFQATVLVDGKKFCTVSNEGHGGPDNFGPVGRQLSLAFRDSLVRFAKRLNPEAEYSFPVAIVDARPSEDFEGDYWRTGKVTAEEILSALVGRALDAFLLERDFKRALSRYLVALHADGAVYTWKLKDKRPGAWAFHERAIRDHAAKNGNAVTAVLNALPFSEALALYVKHTEPKS